MTVRIPDDVYGPGEGPDPRVDPEFVTDRSAKPSGGARGSARDTTGLPSFDEIARGIDLDRSFKHHQETHHYRFDGEPGPLMALLGLGVIMIFAGLAVGAALKLLMILF